LAVQEETQFLVKNIYDLSKIWDAKLERIKTDFDQTRLVKELDKKADEYFVKEKMDGTNYRLEKFEDALSHLSVDMDSIKVHINRFKNFVKGLEGEQKDIMLRSSKNCLSCGDKTQHSP
jgi:archaellum component FlaC